jgi:hypothetical protein
VEILEKTFCIRTVGPIVLWSEAFTIVSQRFAAVNDIDYATIAQDTKGEKVIIHTLTILLLIPLKPPHWASDSSRFSASDPG